MTATEAVAHEAVMIPWMWRRTWWTTSSPRALTQMWTPVGTMDMPNSHGHVMRMVVVARGPGWKGPATWSRYTPAPSHLFASACGLGWAWVDRVAHPGLVSRLAVLLGDYCFVLHQYFLCIVSLPHAQSALDVVPMALVHHAVGECKTLRTVVAGLVDALVPTRGTGAGSVATLCSGRHTLPAAYAELLVRSHLGVLVNWRSTHAKDSNTVVCSTAPWYVVCSHCGLGGHFHFDCSSLRAQ